jgi:hypothetical protein
VPSMFCCAVSEPLFGYHPSCPLPVASPALQSVCLPVPPSTSRAFVRARHCQTTNRRTLGTWTKAARCRDNPASVSGLSTTSHSHRRGPSFSTSAAFSPLPHPSVLFFLLHGSPVQLSLRRPRRFWILAPSCFRHQRQRRLAASRKTRPKPAPAP